MLGTMPLGSLPPARREQQDDHALDLAGFRYGIDMMLSALEQERRYAAMIERARSRGERTGPRETRQVTSRTVRTRSVRRS